MEIADFVFHRPSTLEEAVRLGRLHGRDARYLAGGTELLPDLKQHRDATQHLIALQRIAGLAEIGREGSTLRIGSLAGLREVAESQAVREHLPALGEAILAMAACQIRNRGTLGGNFCSGVPSADTPPICIAAGAEVRIAGPEGIRDLPAEEFFHGPRQTVLSPGEILLEIRIPEQPPDSGASYQRFALRGATALAVASVAARLRVAGGIVREARVVLGAVAPIPLLAGNTGRLLAGKALSEDLLLSAAEMASEEARPISDLRGSAGFRRELVVVLARRALAEAAERARRNGAGRGGARK